MSVSGLWGKGKKGNHARNWLSKKEDANTGSWSHWEGTAYAKRESWLVTLGVTNSRQGKERSKGSRKAGWVERP